MARVGLARLSCGVNAASAVIAIDPDDGALRWHYKWTPHDLWDCDGNNENIPFELDGRKLPTEPCSDASSTQLV